VLLSSSPIRTSRCRDILQTSRFSNLKSKVALEAIKGEKTLSELAQQFDVHANQIKTWRDQLQEGAKEVFMIERKGAKAEPSIDVKTLHAKIGELTFLENDFLETALTKAGLLSTKI